jgi:hypothetical protein
LRKLLDLGKKAERTFASAKKGQPMSQSNSGKIVIASSLLTLSLGAAAYEDRYRDRGYHPEDRLVREHRRFAGSKHNAEELVEGLRYDKPVELSTKNGSTTTFTSPTTKMGWGNVDISLSIAEATLADHGIRNPSPEQIKAALNGGTVTTKSGEVVKLPGVLKLRASGMGWGQIAQKHGFKLGEVMRDGHGHRHHHKHGHRKHDHKHAGPKQDPKRADWKPDHHRADWKHDRGRADSSPDRQRADWKLERGDFHRTRFERPERPHKFDRPERPHRPERPERAHRR